MLLRFCIFSVFLCATSAFLCVTTFYPPPWTLTAKETPLLCVTTVFPRNDYHPFSFTLSILKPNT